MDIKQGYDRWAPQYDTNENKTRDLEGLALRAMLADLAFDTCLEIGCGTGKNTSWLLEKGHQVTAVDLSAGMLARAREKITSDRVHFIQADITTNWLFPKAPYDLVAFSLVLEHLENLNHPFEQAARYLKPGGHLYLGELHPFKQYAGTKARFDTPHGPHILPCFTHHVSDFILAARRQGLEVVTLLEYFDHPDSNGLPRILTILFRKPV